MTDEPFFLVGFQRSGTTMLRLMLNAHPDIGMPHDSAELWSGYQAKLPGYNDLRTPEDSRRMIEDLLAEPRIKAWQTELPKPMLLAQPLPDSFAGVMRRFHEAYLHAHGKRYWGDKNTGTLIELDRLNRLFPQCKFIHLLRDGRDCALSHLSKEYIYGYSNVLRCALEWREQVTLCRKMGAMLPAERFLELRYEDLLAEPERWLARICTFLGVAFSPAMLEYFKDVGSNVPDERRSLWPMIDQPPMQSNTYKWKTKMSPTDRAVFERIAGALLCDCGYETLPAPVTAGRVRELWYHVHDRIAWRLKR